MTTPPLTDAQVTAELDHLARTLRERNPRTDTWEQWWQRLDRQVLALPDWVQVKAELGRNY